MFKETKKGIKVKLNFNKIDVPNKDENSFFVEDNGRSMFDAIYSISQNEKILDLSIISFRISKADLSTLELMNFDFKIKLFLSDSIKTMVVGTFNYLIDNPNFETHYDNYHEKSVFVRTENNYYFLTSSGNFNPDGKIESLYFFNSLELYQNLLPL